VLVAENRINKINETILKKAMLLRYIYFFVAEEQCITYWGYVLFNRV
jgi:hypothetical protein